MRTLLSVLVVSSALLAVTSPSFSMGGGSGSMGGSMGYGGTTAPEADDYKVALRLIKHEQYQDAIPHLLMAHAKRPQDADILNYLGYTNRMTGNLDSSLNYYKQALAIDPNHKGVHEYLGELYLKMNDQASAQHELETLASLCPSGCEERDVLTKAVAAYIPPAGATPAAPATPATPSSGGASN